jgi:hypothetical protein
MSKKIQTPRAQARKVSPKPEVRKRGRPPKLSDDAATLRMISKLAEIQATQREAAGVLGVGESTFTQFLGSEAGKRGRDSWEMGRAAGRANLRKLQWRAAERGSITMMIWLGKQWLEQRDKIERTETVDPMITSSSVNTLETPDYESINDKRQQLKAFEEFRRKLTASYVPPKLPPKDKLQ